MAGFERPDSDELRLPSWRTERRGPTLVTGGSGFIGSHIVRALMDSGREAIIYDVLEPTPDRRFVIGETAGHLAFARGSVDDRARLFDVVKRHGVTEIVHASTIIDPDILVRERDRGFSVNVLGTVNVLEAGRTLEVSSIIYCSSIGVLPAKLYEPIDADHPVILADRGPGDDFYGAHKVASEALCFAYQQSLGLEFRAIRPSAVYGLGMNAWVGPIKEMVEGSVRGERIRFPTGGSHPRDYTHASDVASLVVTLLNAPSGGGDRVFYAATGEPLVTTSEVARLVNELIPGADVEIGEPLSEGEKTVAAYRGQLAVQNARELGWRPRFLSLRDGIVNYAEAYRAFLADTNR